MDVISSVLLPRQQSQAQAPGPLTPQAVAMLEKQGAPFPPVHASLGGRPTKGVDVPICSVFLALFVTGAVCHMTILQVNQRRGHKFLFSGLLFGFCMARIVTQIMRIVWACYPNNLRVAIASNVFVAAGVLLLFIVNLLFAQRMIRAAHPNLGWHKFFNAFFIGIYVAIVVTLAMLITCVIQSFYSLRPNTLRIDRDVQLYGQTFYAVISFLPIPMVLFAALAPRKNKLEKFGAGRWRHKVWILLISAVLICAGASFRTGVNYAGGERPISDPAPYQSKACFYIFNFAVEILVVLGYVLVRVDKRFHVPDGSSGPGDYARGFATKKDVEAPEAQEEKPVEAATGAAKDRNDSYDSEMVSDLSSGDEGHKSKRERRDEAFERVIEPEEEAFEGMTDDELARRDALKAEAKEEHSRTV